MSKPRNNKELNEFLTTAIEGGINYWANDDDVCIVDHYDRDPETIDVTKVVLKTDVDGKGWKDHVITATEIRKALNAMREDQKLSEGWRKCAAKLLFDNESDYDAADADAVFQYACFNEIVFG